MDGWMDRQVDRWLIDNLSVCVFTHNCTSWIIFRGLTTRNIYFLIVLEPRRAPVAWISVRPLSSTYRQSPLSVSSERERESSISALFLSHLVDLVGTPFVLCLYSGPGVQSILFTTTSQPPVSSCAVWMRCGPLSWGLYIASSTALLPTSSRRFYWWMTSAPKVRQLPPWKIKVWCELITVWIQKLQDNLIRNEFFINAKSLFDIVA